MSSNMNMQTKGSSGITVEDVWGLGNPTLNPYVTQRDYGVSPYDPRYGVHNPNVIRKKRTLYCIYLGDRDYVSMSMHGDFGSTIGMENADVFYYEEAEQVIRENAIRGAIIKWKSRKPHGDGTQ